MAAEGKIDPMHQFTVEPIAPLHVGGYDISFTSSSAWMLVTLALIFGFMALGMKRELVPGRHLRDEWPGMHKLPTLPRC